MNPSSASTKAHDMVESADIFKRNCLSNSSGLALGFLLAPSLMVLIYFRIPLMSVGCLVKESLAKTMNASVQAPRDVILFGLVLGAITNRTFKMGRLCWSVLSVSGSYSISLDRSIKSFCPNIFFHGLCNMDA